MSVEQSAGRPEHARLGHMPSIANFLTNGCQLQYAGWMTDPEFLPVEACRICELVCDRAADLACGRQAHCARQRCRLVWQPHRHHLGDNIRVFCINDTRTRTVVGLTSDDRA